MPQGPDGNTIIIVKKVSGHAAHHGGSWKVAYADFVTSMMCLFLVLWLVNSASESTRQKIASYFRKAGIFEMGSGSPIETGHGGILSESFAPPDEAKSQVEATKLIYDNEPTGSGQGDISRFAEEQAKLAQAMEKLEEEMKENSRLIEGLLGQVEITMDSTGLHIEIMDTSKASMFEPGSATISPKAETQLLEISRILAALPNPIDVEGHTDGIPFHRKLRDQYDNWNLSSERANEARRVMERGGIDPSQVARIVGYADRKLKFTAEPSNPGNRRISITMRYNSKPAEFLPCSSYM